jgi:hypothetical protein
MKKRNEKIKAIEINGAKKHNEKASASPPKEMGQQHGPNRSSRLGNGERA